MLQGSLQRSGGLPAIRRLQKMTGSVRGRKSTAGPAERVVVLKGEGDAAQEPDGMKDRVFGGDPFALLRRRWNVLPAGNGRVAAADLMALSDAELLTTWHRLRDDATTGPAFGVRGWYHTLYRDVLAGRTAVDVGAGLGLDGLTFAAHGARMIFVDIVEDNLALLRRLAGLLDVRDASYLYLDDLAALRTLPDRVDVIWCQGSMINVPFGFAAREASALLEHLPVGGRWIELAYPRARWEREGALPFHLWGERTDGPGTPWVEWYDRDRLLRRLEPAAFDVVLDIEFHNCQLVWFDLCRIR